MSYDDEVISEKLVKRASSWKWDKVIKTLDGKVFKTSIRRDAYDNQCSANVRIWVDEDKSWNFVYSMPIEDCACYKVSYTDDNPLPFLFQKDHEELMNIAKKIVR